MTGTHYRESGFSGGNRSIYTSCTYNCRKLKAREKGIPVGENWKK
jgi:hypothetical protein